MARRPPAIAEISRLDDKVPSRFGKHLIEASKYGTTAFPISFAATVARFLRAIALHKCEAGAKLGVSEEDSLLESG